MQIIKRIPEWLRLAFVAVCSIGVAFASMAYVSNSIVVGALIGLPGRESDIAHAQHFATSWIVAAVFAQLGVILSVFSLLPVGAESPKFTRITVRICLAIFLSFPITFGAGIGLTIVMKSLG
jgi:hypothetical protein